MSKRIHHMGMTITRAAHEQFHKEGGELPPERHAALMKRLGVTKEEDEQWHRTHLTLAEQRAVREGLAAINPLAVGSAFLTWCVKQGWVVQRRKQYFTTRDGAKELSDRFGITV